MDTFLLGVAVVALALAALLAVLSWRLLRDNRHRSAARVAALESLALTDTDTDAEAEWDFRLPAAGAFEPEPGELGLELGPEPKWEPEPETGPEPWEPEFELEPAPEPIAAAPLTRPAAAGSRYAPIPVSEGMFGVAAAEAGAPRRRWAVLAAVAVVVAGSAGTAYGLRGSQTLTTLSLPSFGRGASAAQTEPLELLSLRHDVDPSGAFSVTGLVQNPAGGRPVAGVAAVVYLFDKEGRYFASGRVSLDPATLSPGEESPFHISIPDAAGVGRYRVGFRHDDGGVVAHVDRRGQVPAGTTGDSVEGTAPTSAPPATVRGRVEGE